MTQISYVLLCLCVCVGHLVHFSRNIVNILSDLGDFHKILSFLIKILLAKKKKNYGLIDS